MLILKQNAANSVPTPPAGKGTIFLDDSDTLSVKTSDGNVETFPTVAAANTQVVFIDGTALSGNANFVYNKNTDTLTLSGTLATGNVKTDNLLYANGTPWDLSDPGGSNTQVQFNDDESFGGSAAFTFNKSTNAVSMGGSLTVTGNASAGNISTGGALSVTGNANVGNLGTGGLIVATGNITGGNLVTTGTGSVGELAVSGNAVITGNLAVNGNVTYVNVDTLQVEDPIIELGGGPNGAPLTNNDGKDRGTLLHYYTTSAIDAFMGWDSSNTEFSFGSNVTVVNDVVTFNALGNVRVGNIIGNGQALTGLTGANVTGQVGNAAVAGTVYTNAQPNITSVGTLSSLAVTGNASAGNLSTGGVLSVTGNANVGNIGAGAGVFSGNVSALNVDGGNLVTANYVAGTLTTAAQPNITSVGTLSSLLTGTSALGTDFPNATSIFAHDNTGVLGTDNFGLVGEATGDGANASTTGVGVFGIGKANAGTRGTGVQGFATVTNSADTGAAVGVRGYATTTHSGGYNIGVLGNAAGSGFGNYAFYVQAGNIASIETDTAWDLNDNSANALAFNSSGKANILRIDTTDGSEGVAMSGTLAVTGNATVGGIKTDNYYYANGSPVDFQQAGGSNTQVQFNDADGFGGSAAFTFNKTTNAVSMTGNLTAGNVSATDVSGTTLGGTLTTAAQPNVTSVGTLTSLAVTGNISGGNVNAGNLLTANFVGGTLTTAAQPNVTSVGTLTALSVDGSNISLANGVYVGNGSGLSAIAGANVTGTVANATHASTANTVVDAAQPNITSVGTLTSLTVSGNAGFGNISTGGALSVTGNANVGNLGVTGVLATTLGGTLTTAAQPNVTSVGTLTSISVTGNATAGNVYANSGTIGASLLAGTLTTAAQPNITSVGTLTGLAVNGNITAANITANTGVFTGNGSGLSAIAGGNVTGQVANALVAGTVYTAAQPNITSVGTLTSLSVTGNAAAGNISTGGTLSVTGNANVGNIGAATGVFTTVAGTLTTAAQPNITSVGTLSSLSVTANVAAGNLTTTGILSVTGTGTSSIAGNLDMTSNNIVNLASPVNDNDAATKAYVDNLTSTGIHYHTPVRVESPTALNATYNNGTAGVGATLTNAGANAALVIDGISLNVADRVLVYQQTNQVQNGVYVVTTVGDGSTAWVLTRASDADTYAPSTSTGLDEGSYFYVQEGNTGAGESYVCNTVGTITFGTTNITFAQFSASQVYQAGTGLTLTNTTFSVNASQTQITSVGTLGSLTVSGNASAGNISTGGTLSATGNANVGNIGATNGVFTSVSGNGSALTALNASNISTGTLAQARLANASLTLGSTTLTLGGTTTTVAGLSSVTSTTFVGALTGAATTAGTVTTNAQPNITSVGTLTSLAVTGNASAGNISTGGALSVTGNANVGNIGATAGVFTNVSGNGAALTALNASNISTGTLAQARLANSSLTVNGTSISLGGSGTITANTTQTLTLGSYLTGTSFNGGTAVTATVDATDAATASKVVARDANASFAGNVITATTFSGSGASISSLNASNLSSGTVPSARLSGSYSISVTSATTAGTVTTAAQPNITSVGTLTSLSVTGNVSAGNLVSQGTVGGANADLYGHVLTTGANTTAGTITGNWTLSAGSRWNATYADLAEKYVADAHYEPGTVLVFGGEHEVTLANQFDSTRVAGVVTTDPAFSMNSACAGEHVAEIALQGRVPCKVHGPVAKGDLMVAGQNGHAVANNMARAGTIIGKALQNFEGGSGVIEVAVGRF